MANLNPGVGLSRDAISPMISVIDLPVDQHIKREFDASGNMLYFGINNKIATDDDSKWIIVKHTIDGSGFVTDTQCLYGSWSQRAALAWI